MTLGQQIAAARKEKGMTQEMGSIINVGVGRNPGPDFIKKVEHTNQNLYNKRVPLPNRKENEMYVLRK